MKHETDLSRAKEVFFLSELLVYFSIILTYIEAISSRRRASEGDTTWCCLGCIRHPSSLIKQPDYDPECAVGALIHSVDYLLSFIWIPIGAVGGGRYFEGMGGRI